MTVIALSQALILILSIHIATEWAAGEIVRNQTHRLFMDPLS